MTFRKSVVLSLLSVLALIIFFQNCGDVSVQSAQPSTLPVVKLSRQEQICAPYGYHFGAPLRFIFVMDMSISNIGSLSTETNIVSGRTTTSWFINTHESTHPTDPEGRRFDLVKEFIEDCSGGENVTYSVLGFGGTAILPANETCLSAFKPKDQALQLIDGMKTIQEVDLRDHQHGIINGFDIDIPVVMQNQTKYSSAISCLAQKVAEDLYVLPENEKPIYYVFFLTDGAPTDLETELNQLVPNIQSLSSQVSERAGGFRFVPIMYTVDGAMSVDQRTKAITSLDGMAHAVSSGVDTLQLDEIGSPLGNVFCEQVQPQSKSTYQLTNVFAVNLSAKANKSVLQSDSDQDGVSDQQEIQYGWDPLDAHSTGVLDGLCLRYSTRKEDCQEVIENLECPVPSFQVGLLINSCDHLFSNRIFGKPLDFIDTDRDEIPDLVEILRSTNPASQDALAMPFSDRVSNLQKIKWGFDIQSSAETGALPEEQKVLVRFSEDEEACSADSKSYSVFIDQLPIVPGFSYVDPVKSPIDLSHESGENIYMLYSVWQTQGGTSVQRKIQSKALKVKESKIEAFGPSNMKIRGVLE